MKFHSGNRGASMVEYVLIITLIAVGMIFVISMFGQDLRNLIYQSGDSLNNEVANQSAGTAGTKNQQSSGGSGAAVDHTAAPLAPGAVPEGSSAIDVVNSNSQSSGPQPKHEMTADGKIKPKDKDPNSLLVPKYSKDGLYTLSGDERSWQIEQQNEKWKRFIRYLITFLTISLSIALLVVMVIRVRAIIKQVRSQVR